ncbi:MAG: DctP family TRAP transporter solute-binding subunit [Clostridiales bacterium]|nr:DctP family TRAP transporter solute-binding subunit [Clostridiales bacterium]
MKKTRKCLALICALMMAFGLSACSSSSKETTPAANQPADKGTEAAAPADASYTFNISVDASEEETIYKYAEKLAECVEAKSNGQIDCVVYGNGTLGGDSEALQSVADGSLAFVLSTTAPQVNLMPELAMFDLPNLFTDIEQFRSLFDNEEFTAKLNEIYTNGGFKLLGIADSGFRQMTSNVKVESLADMAGIKIRTMQNSNHIAIWQAYGANPTPMSFSEVYIGLQQGTIDAQENPVEVAVSSKFYEQQKYLILTNHLPHACVCLMSSAVFNDLPEDLQQAVIEAGEEATQYTRDLSDSQTAEQLEFLKQNDTEVIELSDDVQAQMKDACADVYDSIRQQIGDDMMDLMLEAAGK